MENKEEKIICPYCKEQLAEIEKEFFIYNGVCKNCFTEYFMTIIKGIDVKESD